MNGFLGSIFHTRILFLCLFLLAWTALPAQDSIFTEKDNGETSRFDLLITSISESYRVDPILVKALIWKESKFRPLARGKSGEFGLMQIKREVAIDWSKAMKKPMPTDEELFDPYVNLEIGVWHLSRALSNWKDRSNQYALALCEYNAGRTKMLRWLAHNNGEHDRVVLYSASAKYARDIIDKFIEYTLHSESDYLASANMPVNLMRD